MGQLIWVSFATVRRTSRMQGIGSGIFLIVTAPSRGAAQLNQRGPYAQRIKVCKIYES